MRLKTFRAFTLAEALDAVHEDLGQGAAILHTRTFRRGGFLGLGGREIVEVIASEQRPETSILPAVTRPREFETADTTSAAGSPTDRLGLGRTAPARARAAYAVASGTDAAAADGVAGDADHAIDRTDATAVVGDESEAPVTSASLEVDRDRTRKLAQAMAIRLERQRAARAAAGVAGPDDLIGDPAADASTDVLAEAPAEASPSDRSTPSRTESFVIGPGGVLLPTSNSSAPTPVASPPRVVSLDTERLVADPATGVPVASTDGFVADVVPTITVTPEAPAASEPVTERPVLAREASPTPAEPSELDAIRRTVGRVLSEGGLPESDARPSNASSTPDPLADAYAGLVAQELSRDLAERVVATLESTLDGEARRDPARVRAAMLAQIADLVPTAESLETSRPRDGRPRTIAFVGPTGVGKTTTLAKIAATLVLRERLSVALVTADTYRISAVDQLRTYADILGARIEVAADPAAMREAIERCGDVDAVLVDTPGRSQNDVDRLAELRAIVDAARPHETHLVLSGTASERVLIREAEAFASLGPDRVVLTKLDEAVAFGMLVSVVRRIGRRISWVTTGQEVPRDIERATGSRLADLVLGGAVKA